MCKVAARVQSCNMSCKDYSSTLNARFTLLKIVIFFIPLRFRQTFPSSKWRINNTLFRKQWSPERKSPRQSSIPSAKKMNLLCLFKLRTEFSPMPSYPVWPWGTRSAGLSILQQPLLSFTRVIPISVTLEVYFNRELYRKVSYLQGRLTNPEYNFIIIQLFWKTNWKQMCSETFFQQHWTHIL